MSSHGGFASVFIQSLYWAETRRALEHCTCLLTSALQLVFSLASSEASSSPPLTSQLVVLLQKSVRKSSHFSGALPESSELHPGRAARTSKPANSHFPVFIGNSLTLAVDREAPGIWGSV